MSTSSRITHFILDEADRMLDMGFIHDVKKIVGRLPARRHSLLFSATMPSEVASLAGEILHRPTRVEVAPAATTVDTVRQFVYFVSSADKHHLLQELLDDQALSRVLLFARTKHRANRIAKKISSTGITADAIHGNKSQNARQAALERFRVGLTRVLVATDIAARGLDIDGISHVINFELPHEPESYVHRIGRTARAGAYGCALSFCDPDEVPQLRAIEKLARVTLQNVRDQPFYTPPPAPQRARQSRPVRSHPAGRPNGTWRNGTWPNGARPNGARRRRRRPVTST